MVIHERDPGDTLDMDNFLSVYRSGEAWSRWGFNREGAVLRAWCCLTGVDIGEFATMQAALETVLLGRPAAAATEARVVSLRAEPAGATITDLRSARFARALGSAA